MKVLYTPVSNPIKLVTALPVGTVYLCSHGIRVLIRYGVWGDDSAKYSLDPSTGRFSLVGDNDKYDEAYPEAALNVNKASS